MKGQKFMIEDNKRIFDEMLGILEDKNYFVNDDKKVLLKLSYDKMRQIEIYLPERISKIRAVSDEEVENSK